MKRMLQLVVLALLSLSLPLSLAPPRALAASPSNAAQLDLTFAHVERMAIPITSAPREVAAARAAANGYRYLAPAGYQSVQAHARLFKLDSGQLMVAIPLAAKGWSGGSFVFIFQDGESVANQQLIIEELSSESGRVRTYVDGELTLDRVVVSSPDSDSSDVMVRASPAFDRCHNNLPGWIKEVMSLMCAVGGLGFANPILAMWCVMCLLGLGGIYASYALKCLNAK